MSEVLKIQADDDATAVAAVMGYSDDDGHWRGYQPSPAHEAMAEALVASLEQAKAFRCADPVVDVDDEKVSGRQILVDTISQALFNADIDQPRWLTTDQRDVFTELALMGADERDIPLQLIHVLRDDALLATVINDEDLDLESASLSEMDDAEDLYAIAAALRHPGVIEFLKRMGFSARLTGFVAELPEMTRAVIEGTIRGH